MVLVKVLVLYALPFGGEKAELIYFVLKLSL